MEVIILFQLEQRNIKQFYASQCFCQCMYTSLRIEGSQADEFHCLPADRIKSKASHP